MTDETELVAASRAGDIIRVKRSLATGCCLHAGHDEALSVAADHGHIDVVNVLVAAGANVHNGYAMD